MSLKIVDSTGVTRTIKRLTFVDQTGTSRVLQQLSLRDQTATLRPIFAGIDATAYPATVRGVGSGAGVENVATDSTMATVIGGTGPYAYAWSEVTGGAYAWSIDSPALASTTFTSLDMLPGDRNSGIFKCTITDANSNVAETNNVAASALNGEV